MKYKLVNYFSHLNSSISNFFKLENYYLYLPSSTKKYNLLAFLYCLNFIHLFLFENEIYKEFYSSINLLLIFSLLIQSIYIFNLVPKFFKKKYNYAFCFFSMFLLYFINGYFSSFTIATPYTLIFLGINLFSAIYLLGTLVGLITYTSSIFLSFTLFNIMLFNTKTYFYYEGYTNYIYVILALTFLACNIIRGRHIENIIREGKEKFIYFTPNDKHTKDYLIRVLNLKSTTEADFCYIKDEAYFIEKDTQTIFLAVSNFVLKDFFPPKEGDYLEKDIKLEKDDFFEMQLYNCIRTNTAKDPDCYTLINGKKTKNAPFIKIRDFYYLLHQYVEESSFRKMIKLACEMHDNNIEIPNSFFNLIVYSMPKDIIEDTVKKNSIFNLGEFITERIEKVRSIYVPDKKYKINMDKKINGIFLSSDLSYIKVAFDVVIMFIMKYGTNETLNINIEISVNATNFIDQEINYKIFFNNIEMSDTIFSKFLDSVYSEDSNYNSYGGHACKASFLTCSGVIKSKTEQEDGKIISLDFFKHY